MREDCSPRHVPNEVRQIAEVPRTLSGKVLEVPVKRILTGTPPEQAASRESLANPAALDYFVSLVDEYAERPPTRTECSMPHGFGGATSLSYGLLCELCQRFSLLPGRFSPVSSQR